MSQFWRYQSPQQLRERREEQRKERESKGGGGLLGKIANVATEPFEEAGKATLKGLDWYDKRFARPSMAWGTQALAKLAQTKALNWEIELGGIDKEGFRTRHTIPGTGIGVGVERGGPKLFGQSWDELDDDGDMVNPLRAWAGDEKELEKADKFIDNMSPFNQLVMGIVFDPSNWLFYGSGAAGRQLTKQGAKMLGTSPDAVLAAYDLRNLARKGARNLPGGSKFVKEGLDIAGTLPKTAEGDAGRAMIMAGTILRSIEGTPELLLDSFLRGGVRPITEHIPGLRLAYKPGKDGAMRIGIEPTLLGNKSARGQLDQVQTETADMFRHAESEVLAANPNMLIEDPYRARASVFKKIANPATNIEEWSPFARNAYQDTQNVHMDDLIYRAEAGEDMYALRKDLTERISDQRRSRLGIPKAKEIDKLPTRQKLIAKLTRMDKGVRFGDNKLAATWMHGVLFSPFYVLQNAMTDPLFAQSLKMGMDPDLARVAMGGRLQLYDNLVSRTGEQARYGTASLDPDSVIRNIEEGEIAGQPSMSQVYMANPNTKAGGGYIVSGVDKLSKYASRVPMVGKHLAKGLKVGVELPHQSAMALDEGFVRRVIELEYGRRLNTNLAYSSNPTLATLPLRADESYNHLKSLGVPKKYAEAVSRLELNARNKQEYLDGIRSILAGNPAKGMDWTPLDPAMYPDPELIEAVNKSISDHWKQGIGDVQSGKKVQTFNERGEPEVKVIPGLDEIKRKMLPAKVVRNVETSIPMMRETMYSMIDDVGSQSAKTTLRTIVDDTYNELARLEAILKKPMTHKKAKAMDAAFYGDLYLRTAVTRQSINRFLTDAIESVAQDPSQIAHWSRNRPRIGQGGTRFMQEASSFIEDSQKLRTSLLKKPIKAELATGELRSRQAWGNFRDKYNLEDVLPEMPDMDALRDVVREGTNSKFNNYIDFLYSTMKVEGEDLPVEMNWFQKMHAEVDGYAKQAQEIADFQAASSSPAYQWALSRADELPQNDPAIAAALNKESQKAVNDAYDLSTERMGDFYEGTTNLDELLAWFFPFNRFATRVASLGPRALSRNVPLMPAFYRWQHASEKEFGPVPGWAPLVGNISFNPMGGLAPYQQYQALTDPRVYGEGLVERGLKATGTAGFGAGPGLTAILSQIGQIEPEGDLVPGQKVLRAAEAYGLPGAGLSDRFLTTLGNTLYGTEGNPAFDRQIEQSLADMGLNPGEVAQGSPEWNAAKDEAAKVQGFNYFLSGAALNEIPTERIEFAKKEAEALLDQGISKDEQIGLRRAEKSPWDLLNSEQKEAVVQQIGEEEFRARTASTPRGLNRQERELYHGMQTYYASLNINKSTLDNEVREIGQRLAEGAITGQEYREQRRMAYLAYGEQIGTVKRVALSRLYGADILNANKFDEETVEEMWQEARDDLRVSSGKEIKRTLFEEDEALDDYRSIQPELFLDPVTGEIDWDSWSNFKQGFLDLQPAGTRQYIQNIEDRRISRDPVEQEYEQAKTLMDEYQSLPRYIGMTPEEENIAYQSLRVLGIMEAQGVEERQAMNTIRQEDPEAFRLMRKAMRGRNPQRKKYWDANPLLAVFFSS